MKLSDIMSATDLAVYAEVALIIFFVIFIGIAVYVAFAKKRKQKKWDEARYLPLDDDERDAPRFPRDEHSPAHPGAGNGT